MNKRSKQSRLTLIGGFAFFLMVAVILTVAVMTYSFIKDSFGTVQIAVIMMIVVVALSVLCTFVDYIRRKLTTDKYVNQILEATETIANGDFNINLKPEHRLGGYDAYDLIKENISKMAKELSRNEVLKTDFVSNVSHEIKTPLAVIANYATLLQEETLTSDRRNAYSANILRATRRLTNLVSNILKLNKLEKTC